MHGVDVLEAVGLKGFICTPRAYLLGVEESGRENCK